MTKTALCVLLGVMLAVTSGCGPNQAANPAPAERENQAEAGQAVSGTEVKAGTTEIRPASEASKQRKFGAVETRPDRVKAKFYYGEAITRAYLLAKSWAVESAKEINDLARFFDDDSAILRREKKAVEDCFSQGTKMRLVRYVHFKDSEFSRSIVNTPKYSVYEMKVYAEYSYEYTYADNRKETRKERKVFTVREERETGLRLTPGTPDYFANKIAVVIVNIEDAAKTNS